MLEFLSVPADERSIRTTYMHMIETHGWEKHVAFIWAERDQAYKAANGEPKSTGKYPIQRASDEDKDAKVVKMKAVAKRT